MLNKNIFTKLSDIWFSQNPSMKKYHLADKLGVSKQYISRALSDNRNDSISSKHIEKLMELTSHAVVMYPGGHIAIVEMNHEQILEQAKEQ